MDVWGFLNENLNRLTKITTNVQISQELEPDFRAVANTNDAEILFGEKTEIIFKV